MIVRKCDGGYGYRSPTWPRSGTGSGPARRPADLRRRCPQADHFAQVFAVPAGRLAARRRDRRARRSAVLGPDGKPYKTREGTAITLPILLDTAEEKAAPPIALAAIKYADLSNGLNKDYVFDIDRMVQTTGNTGPYLQYAHARMAQVLRKAAAEGLGSSRRSGARRAGRAGAGPAADPVRRDRRRGRTDTAAAPALRLPV